MTLIPPTEEQEALMNKELYQDPELTKMDIVRLKDWLKKQPHLPQTIDDARLERFLHGCKFSVERSKQILDTYYTVRAGIPEFFADRDPLAEDVQKAFRNASYFPLPSLTPEGYRVTIAGVMNEDVNHFNIQEMAKRIIMVLDLRLLEEKCLNNIMIFDLDGITAAHLYKCSPTLDIVRKALLSIQDAFPMRLAQVHMVNAPSIIHKAITIVSSLIKEKLVRKFHVHSGGLETLYKYVPKKILPREYGGEAGTIQELNDAWIAKVMNHRDWFLEDSLSSKADESKRCSKYKTKTAMSLEEIHGTYRQLTID